MTQEQIILLIVPLLTFLLLQMMTISIGNRQYSIHYKTHLLVKKKGLAKLIYFKPQHFHRYSFWEVLSFFFSYLQLIIFLVLFCFSFSDKQIAVMGEYLAFGVLLLSFFGDFFKILYIDISHHIEEKNIPINKSNLDVPDEFKSQINKKLFNSILEYSQTIRGKLELAYEEHLRKIKKDNYEAIEKLDEQFIQYFKDYKLVDVENKKVVYKNGKYARFEIVFVLSSKARETFPNLNDNSYRPHFVIKGTKKYLGFAFESSSINEFDTEGKAVVRTLYSLNQYSNFVPNTEFTIREGNKIIGNGNVIKKYDQE